jgi:glycosyltransferase involved in cell wall biosynthesis
MLKASIIIPTYKRSEFLIRAINSVYAQDFKDYELIVVDDNGEGSDFQLQNSIDLEEFIKHPNFVYVAYSKTKGACFARNEGAKIAKGEYLFFLDDDDCFLPNKLSFQIKIMESNLELDGCISAFKRLDTYGNEILSDSNFPSVKSISKFVLEGNFFTPMLCMKKTSFEKVGGFISIPRFQDRFFMLHCLQMGFQFTEINTPLYVMEEHTLPRITNQGVVNSIKSLDIIEKYVLQNVKLSATQKRQFLLQNIEEKAKEYYVTKSYYRLISVKYWIRLYFSKGKLQYLIMAIKSVIPFR